MADACGYYIDYVVRNYRASGWQGMEYHIGCCFGNTPCAHRILLAAQLITVRKEKEPLLHLMMKGCGNGSFL
jgi:hypothetical protein